MKAIMVMFDSLNRHYLPNFGCDLTHMPNFKRLSDKTVTFDNCYVGSMPCMPARRELHTGRYNMLHRGWGPVEPFDDSMPEILKNEGVYTHLISDHHHYWEDGGATYHTRYNTWEIVRGQEGDRWKGFVEPVASPGHIGGWGRYNQASRQYIKTEEDMPQSKVFRLGLEFLDKNRDADNWFLQLETFDPHEPFFSMEEYQKLYPHEYKGVHFDWPLYRPVAEEKEEIAHIRHLYFALLSMCDNYLGKVLDYMDKYDMWKDTMLIVNTDHGFLLGEHDWWAKCVNPFYNEIAHTPLFVYDPRLNVRGERRNSLVQTIDIAPTILEYFGKEIPKDMLGVPLKNVILTDEPVREAGLFGLFGGQLNVTDGRYVYMRACQNEDNSPLYCYTHMPTHMQNMFTLSEMRTMEWGAPFSFTKGCPVMKIKEVPAVPSLTPNEAKKIHGELGKRAEVHKTMLFDLKSDPYQENPINDKEIENRMIRLMVDLMKQNDAPIEQYQRLGLEDYL